MINYNDKKNKNSFCRLLIKYHNDENTSNNNPFIANHSTLPFL